MNYNEKIMWKLPHGYNVTLKFDGEDTYAFLPFPEYELEGIYKAKIKDLVTKEEIEETVVIKSLKKISATCHLIRMGIFK